MDKRKYKRLLRKVGKAASHAKRLYESGAIDSETAAQWFKEECFLRCGSKNMRALYEVAHGLRAVKN